MANNMSEGEQRTSSRIHLMTMLADILNYWVSIVLAGLIAAMGMYVWLMWTYVPQYEMSASYAVVQKTYTGYTYVSYSSVSYEAATTFKYLIDSDILKEQIANAMGVDSIDGELRTEILADTNIMNMTVRAGSPQQCYAIMTAVTENYQELIDFVLGNVTLDMLESPVIPTSPCNRPDTMRYVLRAAEIGMLIMIFLLGLTSYLKDTIKTERDVKDKLNLRILAVVPKEWRRFSQGGWFKKKKRDILITNHPISFGFNEAVEKLRTSFEYAAAKHDCHVILVTSTLANEGKSTISANLSLSLAKKGKKVVFIDGDLRNPTLYRMLKVGTKLKRDLGEYLQGECEFKDACCRYKGTDMIVLMGKNSYDNAAELLVSARMQKLIGALRRQMDYIIIDTPPVGFMTDTEEISEYADGVVLVVRQNYAAARFIDDTVEGLSQTNIQVLGCVLNNMLTMPNGGMAGSGRHHKYSVGYDSEES